MSESSDKLKRQGRLKSVVRGNGLIFTQQHALVQQDVLMLRTDVRSSSSFWGLGAMLGARLGCISVTPERGVDHSPLLSSL